MSKFFCDSNSEIWYTKADKFGLNVIGMPYTIGNDDEKPYDLGRNTDFKLFFERLKNGEDAKTQALNTQNYIDYFEPTLKSGEDIIYVHFSDKMSGTFEQMKKAIILLKEKYPSRSIKTVDTKSISVGEGLIVQETAKMWENGATDDEIIEYVQKYRKNYAVYFLVGDLKYLRQGGRLSATSFAVGTILNIKPILKINDDGQIVKAKTANGFKRGLRELFNIYKKLASDIYKHQLIIAYTDNENSANDLKQMFLNEFGEKLDIWMQPVGPTIGTHCGPGTIGITFHASHR